MRALDDRLFVLLQVILLYNYSITITALVPSSFQNFHSRHCNVRHDFNSMRPLNGLYRNWRERILCRDRNCIMMAMSDKRLYLRQSKRNWILLVDDEQSIRQALGDYLSDNGYQVTACSDVDMAMSICESDSNDISSNSAPDCIVSDIRMPGKDGIEFLKMLRMHPKLQAIPVVLLTAKGMTVDRINGYKAGADAYLTKPFNPDELLAIIDSCIARRKFLEESGEMSTEEIRHELNDIKNSLMSGRGAGVGQGLVKDTGIILSPIEQNLLEFLCEGLLNREIAQNMNLSTRTVEGYLTALYRKVKVSNRTELVRWAIDTGYVKM